MTECECLDTHTGIFMSFLRIFETFRNFENPGNHPLIAFHNNTACVEIPEIDTCDFEDSVVRCHADQISVHLPKCAFTDGELDLGEIHLGKNLNLLFDT